MAVILAKNGKETEALEAAAWRSPVDSEVVRANPAAVLFRISLAGNYINLGLMLAANRQVRGGT